MKLKSLAMGATLFSILCGSAMAATTECPAVKDITQAVLASGGYSYEALGPDGNEKWVGENPEGQAGDLATFVFTAAAYRAKSSQGNTDVVSCDFEGAAQDAFARLTLYSFRDWKAAPGTAWEVNSPAPDRVESCGSKDQKACAFEYSKLER